VCVYLYQIWYKGLWGRPVLWKSAEVVPVPKTKPVRSIESNLRPISLLPTLAKLFESIVGTWLVDRLAPTLDSNQFGSLKGSSTTHALISLRHLWQTALNRGDCHSLVHRFF